MEVGHSGFDIRLRESAGATAEELGYFGCAERLLGTFVPQGLIIAP